MADLNIWFNRTFGTMYHIINDLKRDDFFISSKFFGTHPNLQSFFLQACDNIEKEPLLNDEEFINYSVDFCKRNCIDLLVPGEFSSSLISKNISQFEKSGVKIAISYRKEFADILASKAKIYEFLRDVIPENIPTFYKVETALEFQNAYQKLFNPLELVCFKPDHGIGGLGFRIIDQNINQIQNLFGYPSSRAPYDYFLKILKSEEGFKPIIMMNYLPGIELSVDCLANNGKLIFSVVKEKRGNLRIIKQMPSVHYICKKICKKFKLTFLFNAQFRYSRDNRLYLIDLNPRPSGGLFHIQKAGYSFMNETLKHYIFNTDISINGLPEKKFIEVEDSLLFLD